VVGGAELGHRSAPIAHQDDQVSIVLEKAAIEARERSELGGRVILRLGELSHHPLDVGGGSPDAGCEFGMKPVKLGIRESGSLAS